MNFRSQKVERILDIFGQMNSEEINHITRKAERIQGRKREQLILDELAEYSPEISQSLARLNQKLDEDFTHSMNNALGNNNTVDWY